jgi:hypothetical protein
MKTIDCPILVFILWLHHIPKFVTRIPNVVRVCDTDVEVFSNQECGDQWS